MREFKSSANTVEAELIAAVDGSAITLADGETVNVPDTFFVKAGAPSIGDYCIRRGDGYLLWRTPAEFERRYKPT